MPYAPALRRLPRPRNAPRPHAGLDYTELLLVAVIDAALAAQNAVVAAEALGLGTVYIGALRNHPLAVATELRLPPRILPVFGLCVGWPDPAKPAVIKPRLPQATVLHREVYSAAAEAAAVTNYNATMAGFYAAQQLCVAGSTRRSGSPGPRPSPGAMRSARPCLGLALSCAEGPFSGCSLNVSLRNGESYVCLRD